MKGDIGMANYEKQVELKCKTLGGIRMQALEAGQYATALSVTHARISLPHASNQQRSIRKESGIWRIKMADNRMGTL